MDDTTSAPVDLKQRSELNLYQKIIKIMEKVSFIEKGADVSTGANSKSYKAIQHDDVTALLHPRCAEWGIVVLPSITNVVVSEIRSEKKYGNNPPELKISYRADVHVDVEFINADKHDERIISKSFSYAIDSGDKATGKAYSMAVKYAYLKTFMLQSGDDEESRDFENRSNYNPNNDRNDRSNNQRNNNRNQSGNHGGNNTGQNKGNSNASNNNGTSSNTGQGNQGKASDQKDQKVSPANENQIGAIKKICDKKGIEVGEKFKSKETCSSQEASQEISRLNSLKV